MPELQTGGVTDALPLPTLEKSSTIGAHLKSNLLLLCGVLSAIGACYLYGFELLQPSADTSWREMGIIYGILVAAGAGLLWFVGLQRIDWWALVMEYWWFSMPIGLAVVFLYVRAEEGSLELGEKD